ncbi:MAG: AAA family ATPase [bacterium]|nr:AAA family ATPase [bacterium]
MFGRSRHPAFDDVQGNSTPFEFCEGWFRSQEDLENQRRVEQQDLHAADPALEFVRKSIERMVPGLSSPRIDRSRPVGRGRSQLVFDKAGQVLSADMLSDGERSLIVLAMTISRRLALLQYGFDAPMKARVATVVIDEIELHLHPKWQRSVLPRLLSAFPSCQFVVTTHSPQVVGSVDVESLFVLEDFNIYPASHPTKGRDSNAILEEVMGATARDPATESELDEAARLVEVGSDEEAEAAVEKLAARFGDDDREVVRLRTALMLRGA